MFIEPENSFGDPVVRELPIGFFSILDSELLVEHKTRLGVIPLNEPL